MKKSGRKKHNVAMASKSKRQDAKKRSSVVYSIPLEERVKRGKAAQRQRITRNLRGGVKPRYYQRVLAEERATHGRQGGR